MIANEVEWEISRHVWPGDGEGGTVAVDVGVGVAEGVGVAVDVAVAVAVGVGDIELNGWASNEPISMRPL